MDNKKQGIWTYAQIFIIVIVIFIGVNKFVFPRYLSPSNSEANPLGQIGLEYYLDKHGEQNNPEGVEAIVRNFGCHQEVHIYKENQLIMRLTYFNGQMYEL